jgi:hypothetical protein
MHSQDLGGDRMRGPGSGLPLPPPAAPPTGRPPPTTLTDESERRGRESRLSSDGGGGGGPRTCWMLVAGEGATEEGRHRGEEGRPDLGLLLPSPDWPPDYGELESTLAAMEEDRVGGTAGTWRLGRGGGGGIATAAAAAEGRLVRRRRDGGRGSSARPLRHRHQRLGPNNKPRVTTRLQPVKTSFY